MITIINVNKSFGDNVIFSDLKGKFENGKLNIILGKNGIGKSTLFDCIVRPYFIDSGNIEVDGKSSVDFNARKKIFYIPSYPFVDERTTGTEYLDFVSFVYKNHGFYAGEYQEELDKLELTDLIGGQIETYSLGMKKKLFFLGSLVSKASNLIYDELFNGLDQMSQKYVKERMAQLVHSQSCVILSTHNTEIISDIGDNYFIINDERNLSIIEKNSKIWLAVLHGKEFIKRLI